MDWSEIKLDIESLKKFPKETQGEIFSKLTDPVIIYNILLAHEEATGKEREYFEFIISKIKRIKFDDDGEVEYQALKRLLIKNATLLKNLFYVDTFFLSIDEDELNKFPKLINFVLLLSPKTQLTIDVDGNYDSIINVLKKIKYNERVDTAMSDNCCQDIDPEDITLSINIVLRGDPGDGDYEYTIIEFYKEVSKLRVFQSEKSIDSLIEELKLKIIDFNGDSILVQKVHRSVKEIRYRPLRDHLDLSYLEKIFPNMTSLAVEPDVRGVNKDDYQIQKLLVYINEEVTTIDIIQYLKALKFLKLHVMHLDINIIPLISNIKTIYKGHIEITYSGINLSNVSFT